MRMGWHRLPLSSSVACTASRRAPRGSAQGLPSSAAFVLLFLLLPLLQGIDPELRKGFFDRFLSNIWTLFGTAGWLAATATGVSRRNPTGWLALGLGWALWILAAGAPSHRVHICAPTRQRPPCTSLLRQARAALARWYHERLFTVQGALAAV